VASTPLHGRWPASMLLRMRDDAVRIGRVARVEAAQLLEQQEMLALVGGGRGRQIGRL